MTDVNKLFREARAQAGMTAPPRGRIKPEVVTLYKRLKAMRAGGQEGSQEYSAARSDLSRLLGRRPWMYGWYDILDVDPNAEPPPRDEGRDWHGAVALRRQLEEACA
jgi:hypothetical protein